MGVETEIAWCDHTFNAWIGCHKISPACKNCYAAVDTFARRSRANGLELWGENAARHVTSADYWKQPAKWNRAAEKAGIRRRVFCASLADVFEDHPALPPVRERLWGVIESTPWLDWLLLTKRPENMVRFAPERWRDAWPSNVWAGATVEDQKAAEKRALWLIEVPARIRFLSVEPMLEAIDLTRIEVIAPKPPYGPGVWLNALTGNLIGPDDMLPGSIDLVIVGGESGPSARPFDIGWARALRDQCRAAGTAHFFKQAGAHVRFDGMSRPGEHWPAGTRTVDDGRGGFRVELRDKKGGDMSEWPADLRIRMMPGDEWPRTEPRP